jgi:hypothetical protein
VGYILFLIFVVLLVAIDLIVGSFFRKPRTVRTAAHLLVGEDNNG